MTYCALKFCKLYSVDTFFPEEKNPIIMLINRAFDDISPSSIFFIFFNFFNSCIHLHKNQLDGLFTDTEHIFKRILNLFLCDS